MSRGKLTSATSWVTGSMLATISVSVSAWLRVSAESTPVSRTLMRETVRRAAWRMGRRRSRRRGPASRSGAGDQVVAATGAGIGTLGADEDPVAGVVERPGHGCRPDVGHRDDDRHEDRRRAATGRGARRRADGPRSPIDDRELAPDAEQHDQDGDRQGGRRRDEQRRRAARCRRRPGRRRRARRR